MHALQVEDVNDDMTVSTLRLTNGIEARTLQHIHYTTWPDHGVPEVRVCIFHTNPHLILSYMIAYLMHKCILHPLF